MSRRLIAITAMAALVLVALGIVAGARFGVIPNPFKKSVAQIAQSVEPSLVTAKVDLFRDGSVSGSGFVYGQADHILITARLLAEAVKASVLDRSGTSFTSDAIGLDTNADFAELETSRLAAAPLKLAAQDLAVGADVYVPHGPSRALAHGVVTALRRDLTIGSVTFHGLIQTNALADPADSGGPMVDGNGEVVGIVETDAGGHAMGIPASLFNAQVRAWAKSDSPLELGPPLVPSTAQSLVLSSLGPGWKVLTAAAWGNATGWHTTWIRDPTNSYGGMSVDVWLIVFGTIVAGQTDYRDRLADASRNGYSMDGSLPGGFGDESTVFQKRSRGEIVYEILWRDRNCVVIFYMAAATPPPPEFSMTSAITIATAQEKPIAANLASY